MEVSKLVVLVLSVVALLIGFTVLLLVMIWPPDAGRPLAEAWNMPHPTVAAHRGASWLAPESTRPAYEIARDMGAHYLEADLQRTSDDVIVAFHDRTLERTTNVADVFPERAMDPFESFTYDELLQLDHGTWFNRAFPDRARESYAGLHPVTLDELIAIAEDGNNNPGLYLETKDAAHHPGIEADILEVLDEAGWYPETPTLNAPNPAINERVGAPTVNLASGQSRIIFQSFYAPSVEVLVDRAPDVPAVYLVSQSMADDDGFAYHRDLAKEMGAAGLGTAGTLGAPWRTGSAHERNLLMHHYTINDRWQLWMLRRFGSDGVFTDRSRLALESYGYADTIDVTAIINALGY